MAGKGITLAEALDKYVYNPQPNSSDSTTSSQPTQADNGRGRFSQTRQSYLENAEQKKEQQRALDAIRPQLNFPQYETVEQTRAALQGFEEKNRGLVNDPLSEVLYEGDVKKYTDQINLLSKFESGELGADFFGRGLDENSLAGQMQKDKAATEQRRAAQQYEAEVSQRISDGLSTEGAMNEKFGRTAPTEQQEQPEEEQSAVDRFMNLISGIGKGNAAAATGGQRLLYELGQGARSQMNEEAYAQAKADYDRALQAYNEELAAWGEQGAQSAYYVLQDAKRKLDAFGTVVEDEVQQKATQVASTLSQELNRQSGEDIAKAKEGLGTVGRIAVDTGAALGDILIDAASGMGALNMAGRVFGKSAIEAEAAGANTAQQLAYGTATAAFATGLNKVIDGLAGVYGKGFGDDAAEAFIAKIASTDKGRNVARAILNIGGEGAEEFTEGAVEPLLKLIYDGGDAIKAVYSSPEAWSEALLDNLYSAAIGSVIGAGGQAVDVARGGYRAKNAVTPLQPSDYTAPKTGLKPTSPQSAQENAGGTQIPPGTQTASTNAPDVLNSNIQPQSPIDIVMEVATGQKNTAPQQGADSTAVNTDPRQHTPVEQAVIDEYQNAVDDNLVNYIETVRDNPNAKIGRYSFKPVSEKAAAKIKELTGIDTAGNKTVIEPRMVGHILKDHGPNGETDQSMKDVNDIARIQYVIDNYDNIEHGGTSSAYVTNKPNGKHGNAQTVVFTKAVNGTYYVVEAVPDTAKKTVFVVSAYMQKKAAGTPSVDAEASRVTSENAAVQPAVYEAEASNPYIAQLGANVNPKSNLGQGGERVRGFETNVASSQITDPALKARVEQDIRTYRQLGNNDTLKKAQDIMLQGLPAAQAQLQEAIGAAKSGMKLAPEMVPLSRLVANELTRNGDTETARLIIADIATELTAAGQLGQAGRILRTADPQTARAAIEKALDKINAEFAARMPNAKWEAALTDADIDLINNTDFTQDGAFERVYEQIARRIGGEMPASWWEKLTELRRINMLLRPRSIIKNTVGNVPMKFLRKGAENLSAAIQKALPQDQRTRGFASAEQKGLAREYYTEHKKDILRQGNRWDINSLVREYKTVFKDGKVVEALSKLTGKDLHNALEGMRQLTYKALEGGDAPFVRSAFVDSLSQYMAARGINSADAITQEAIDFATANAMEATFKNANLVATAINNIKRNGDPSVAMALDVLFPFTTTPTNIVAQMVKYSPGGLVGGLLNALTRGANASNIDAISKGTVGSAVMLLGWALRSMGAITGGEDEDKDKAALDKATGNNIYSIGGKVSYDWAQPVGSLLALGAEISDAVSEQESWTSAFANALYTAGDSVLNMSIFQNVLSVLKGTGATKNLFDTITESGATQLIPGLAGDIAKIIDGTVRSTYTGGNVFEDAAAKMQANIPFASKNLPASVNVKGEPQSRGNYAQSFVDNLITPWNTNRNTRTAADDEVYRIFEETGSKTHFPSVSPYSVEFDGETFKMTGEERAQFQTTQGQTYQDIVNELVNNAVYKNASADVQRKVLEEVRDYSLSAAKNEYLKTKDKDYKMDTKEKTLSILEDPATYLATLAQAKNAQDRKGGTFSSNSADTFKLLIEAGTNNNDLNILAGNLSESQQEIYSGLSSALGQDKANEVYKAVETTNEYGGQNSDAIKAIQIAQTPAVKDFDTFMKTLEVYSPPNSETGKRSATVRRYEAANKQDISYKDWTDVLAQVEKYDNEQDGDTEVYWNDFVGVFGRQQASPLYNIYNKPDGYAIDTHDEEAIEPAKPKTKSKAYRFSPNDIYTILGLG